jgi:drug/metabolite transporter (DMT)-like permease
MTLATAPAWLWIVFTLVAAVAQTARNASQKRLTAELGTLGATHVRFLYGLPFGLTALAAVALLGWRLPAPNAASLLWTAAGAFAQIVATALMLAAMRERSFVVAIAYTKTEPLQVAVFALIFLGEALSPVPALAVAIATIGVVVMSWPSRMAGIAMSWRPVALGIAAGSFFALSAVGFRGGVTALGADNYVAAATLTLVLSLSIQTVALSGWLHLREPAVLPAVLRAWRLSLPAGFLGAFASLNWFLAFALSSPAPVRTLALIEVILAGWVSGKLFAQSTSRREIMGIAILLAGLLLLVSGFGQAAIR